MAEKKQLVLVVESTCALAPYWATINADYLEKIIRSFCADKDTTPATPIPELTLVNFNARGSYSYCLAQRTSWTKNVDVFMEWLSGIHFSGGGGFCDAAIAEGLAEVLMMFPSVHGSRNHQRHCILVAASNPYPFPTPVYKPPDYLGIRSEAHNSDAETVARYFKQYRVSLSVICPRQLPKLKAIYNAGKRNPLATDPPINIAKNGNYLVLISESFMEARAALSRPKLTKLPYTKIDLTQDSYPPTFASPVIGSVSTNISPAIVQEPNTVSSMASAPSSSTLPTSQEMTTSSTDKINVQNSKPIRGRTIRNNVSKSLPRRRGNHNIIKIKNKGMTSSVPNAQPVPLSSQAESTTIPLTVLTIVANDNVATKVGPTQQTTNVFQSRYVKLWEGDLAVQSETKLQRVIVTRLQGYRETKACESLAKDWPTTLLIDRIISRNRLNEKYTGKKDYVIFRALNKHQFLVNLQEKKLCAIIKLPSQMLFVCVTEKVSGLYGWVIPQEMGKYEPQVSGQPKEDDKGHDSSQGKQSMISIN